VTRVAFDRLGNVPFIVKGEVECEGDIIRIEGELIRKRFGLALFNAVLDGDVSIQCDACAEEYTKHIHESIELHISESTIKSDNSIFQDDRKFDVIEFTDGLINIDEIILSEVNAIKYDYNRCPMCEQRDDELFFQGE